MSTRLPTRMGVAAPSIAEASRRLSSIKRAAPATDEGLVTSVTSVSREALLDEPVSPELALVDPELAARLRALMPEIEPQIGLELPQPVLRVLPDPAPDNVVPLVPPELLDAGPAAASFAPPVEPPPLFPVAYGALAVAREGVRRRGGDRDVRHRRDRRKAR